MERAPLRRAPSSPRAPVDPADAARYVLGELPGLDEPAARALALVALVGRTRAEVDELSGEELAAALNRAHKALRRRTYPLPGSGWCERAERLLSDRIDGALEAPGSALLDVHLANCPRCVEHQLRLGQSHDALVEGFAKAQAASEPEPHEPEAGAAAPSEVPALHVVDTTALSPASPPQALPAVALQPSPPAAPPAPWPLPARASALRPVFVSRGALTPEGTWTAIGALAVLIAALVVFVRAGLAKR